MKEESPAIPRYGSQMIGGSNQPSDVAASASSSGLAAPIEIATQMIRVMKDYSGPRQVSRVQSVATGRGEVYPIMDDTAAIGEAIDGTGTPASTQDIQLNSRVINFDLFTSKQLKIDKTWLQDISTMDFLGIAVRALARRLARYGAKTQTLKDASVKNNGLYDDVPVGITLANGSPRTTEFTIDHLRQLWAQVDPAYHMNATVPDTVETSSGQNDGMESPGMTAFMCNFSTFSQLVGLKDGENRPYLLPDYRNPGRLSYLSLIHI